MAASGDEFSRRRRRLHKPYASTPFSSETMGYNNVNPSAFTSICLQRKLHLIIIISIRAANREKKSRVGVSERGATRAFLHHPRHATYVCARHVDTHFYDFVNQTRNASQTQPLSSHIARTAIPDIRGSRTLDSARGAGQK